MILPNRNENSTFVFVFANGSVYDLPKFSNITDYTSANQVYLNTKLFKWIFLLSLSPKYFS